MFDFYKGVIFNRVVYMWDTVEHRNTVNAVRAIGMGQDPGCRLAADHTDAPTHIAILLNDSMCFFRGTAIFPV